MQTVAGNRRLERGRHAPWLPHLRARTPLDCDLPTASPLSVGHKTLIENGNSRRVHCPGSVTGLRPNCVFFAQQSVEKRSKGLWEGRFFIAWGGPIANLAPATEGGIPVSRFPDRRIAPRDTQLPVSFLRPGHQFGVKRFSEKRGARGSSIGAVALDGYGTLSR